MSLIPLSTGPVVKGTVFQGPHGGMSDRSQIGSGLNRHHLVLNVIDGRARCCPLSSSSDAWNAEVSPHFIPYDFNPEFFRHHDSLYAVNVMAREGASYFPIDYIRSVDRVNVPTQFVDMANQLCAAFANDQRFGRLPKVSAKKFKERRIRESIKRIDLTTVDVMKELYPSWEI
jgi:hypothetical protein